MSDLNSLWLKSFTVLCEDRHFTRAAARLNMTQPGMSQHIAKLEQKLGVPLIERDAPGFALTDAGEKTLAMARARWREERDFLESLDDEDEDRGKISVASSGSFAMLLYPALMQWMADAPGISASLTAAPEDSIVAGVLSGSYDVGVIANAPRHPRLTAEYLGAEPLDLILPREWDGRLPRFEDLQSLGFVQHPDGTTYADAVLGSNFAKEYRGAERLHVRSTVNQIGQSPSPWRGGWAIRSSRAAGSSRIRGASSFRLRNSPSPVSSNCIWWNSSEGPGRRGSKNWSAWFEKRPESLNAGSCHPAGSPRHPSRVLSHSSSHLIE